MDAKSIQQSSTILRHSKSNRIKIKPFSKSTFVLRITLAIMAILTVLSFATINFQTIDFWAGLVDTVTNFQTMFTTPQLNHFSFWEGFYAVLITMGLAFLTTLFGAALGLLFGLLSAENLSNKRVSNVIKGSVAFIRAVPTVLWVLIFAVAAGLGSVAAVIGMTFHSAGYLIKAYSESFEELDEGVIEALRASGASWWQIVVQAVIPSSLSYLVSWTFMRFEINFSVAVAMGAAAGAGGIGYNMFMASSFYFDLNEIGAITYYILTFAVLLEVIAIRFKTNISGH
ncbi:PhnE/PtxC family ABC transporter permease [Halobacillus halophilus]|uniref:PhnE/PtxC family ABC transporter permease n=1 Tax=Halobacillus halophilus TaxID=1570 RepID=UPI001CD4F70B|nr:ABC transporter permease subunit [Halobacillus halophilus]MCA1011965.1 ABC transporter permease subunit [Halobacillus halophilus]